MRGETVRLSFSCAGRCDFRLVRGVAAGPEVWAGRPGQHLTGGSGRNGYPGSSDVQRGVQGRLQAVLHHVA